jgi:AraC-like DNA-binding protein
MNLRKIIFIFFVLVFCGLHEVKPNQKTHIKTTAKKNLTDSLFYKNKLQTEDLYQRVVEWEKLLLKDKINLTNEDYKRVALSYAYFNNAEKSSEYAETLIKNTHKTSILDNEVFLNISNTKEFKLLEETYKPEINGRILFFLSIGLIGIFSFIMINIMKNGNIISNFMISFFLLLLSLYIIHSCLFLSKYHFKIPHSLYVSKSIFFLCVPLIYFYFRRVIEKYEFKKVDILHIIPSLIVFIYFIPIYWLSSEEKLDILFNNSVGTIDSSFKGLLYVKIIFLSFYFILSCKIYWKLLLKNNTSKKKAFLWQRIIVFSFFFYVIALGNILKLNTFYSQIFLISMIVTFIVYEMYIKPNFSEKISLSIHRCDSKYKKSGLTESFSLELKEELLRLFQHEKIYRDSRLNLSMLAEKLGTTRHNVSQVINEHFGMSFFRFVNKHRINETILILNRDLHRNLNIIDIVYDVGFNNKVSFNKAFKNQLNMTPSQYKKNIKQI